MKILAIDTANKVCSVALSENGTIITQQTHLESSKQAELLISTINKLLKENNLEYSQIDLVAADIGPGSFTGIRIGLAASKGIAMAAKIPLIGVTSFEALSHLAQNNKIYDNLMVVLNAGRGHIFVQIFTKNETSKPLMVEYEDIVTLAKGYNHITITGEGVDLVEPFLQQSAINYSVLQEPKLPDAAMIALCAFDKFKNVNFINNPAPLYIKPPDAKLPAIMRPKL